jgi:hypothetical protein
LYINIISHLRNSSISTTIPDEDENSFDPSDFFMHSALATEAQQQLQHGDINEDLQVSPSIFSSPSLSPY